MKNEETLRRLQLTQLEILKEVNQVCKENNIVYSLYSGTLLGAIRHKGFIPWDDDLDICMDRNNFNRFAIAWENKNNKNYYLQNIDKDDEFTQTFAKIRKNNTVFLQHGEENLKYNKGIFIDIFILDKVPYGTIKRIIQRIYGYLYLLYSRKFPPIENGKLMNVGCKILLSIVPKTKYKKIRKFCCNKIKRYNNYDGYEYVDYAIFKEVKRYLPKTLMQSTSLLEFENELFPVFKEWDSYLKLAYGNYMELPPREKRVWTHLPICIKFGDGSEEDNKMV